MQGGETLYLYKRRKAGAVFYNRGRYLPTYCKVTKALEYARPNDAISQHCRATVKHSIPISGKFQEVNFIPEGDVYRLITHSKLPLAEEFEKWVFDEVLPTIRKHGIYSNPKLLSGMDMVKLQLQALSEVGAQVSEVSTRVDTLEEKIDKRITLECGQQRTLQRKIANRAYERVGLAFPQCTVENKDRFFQALHKDLKNRFGVASYRDINVNDFTDAIAFVQAWIEPAEVRAAAST